MSVDHIFVRIAATELHLFQTNVDAFCDTFHQMLDTIDGADTFSDEIMWISEFTIAVLGNWDSFLDDLTFPSQEFPESSTCGVAGYHLPEDVQQLAEELELFEQTGLMELLGSLQPRF